MILQVTHDAAPYNFPELLTLSENMSGKRHSTLLVTAKLASVHRPGYEPGTKQHFMNLRACNGTYQDFLKKGRTVVLRCTG